MYCYGYNIMSYNTSTWLAIYPLKLEQLQQTSMYIATRQSSLIQGIALKITCTVRAGSYTVSPLTT